MVQPKLPLSYRIKAQDPKALAEQAGLITPQTALALKPVPSKYISGISEDHLDPQLTDQNQSEESILAEDQRYIESLEKQLISNLGEVLPQEYLNTSTILAADTIRLERQKQVILKQVDLMIDPSTIAVAKADKIRALTSADPAGSTMPSSTKYIESINKLYDPIINPKATPEYQALVSQYNTISTAVDKVKFRKAYWESLVPGWESGLITSFQQSIDYFVVEAQQSSDPKVRQSIVDGLTSSDLEEMQSWFTTISSTFQAVPNDDQLVELANYMSKKVQRPVISLTTESLTIEEIVKTMLGADPTEFPAQLGISPSQALAVLKQSQASPEFIDKLNSLKAYYKGTAENYQKEVLASAAIRAQLIDPELPQLSTGQYLKLMAYQPALVAAEALEAFYSNTTQPWSAFLIRTGLFPAFAGVTTGLVAGGLTGNPAIGLGFGTAAALGATVPVVIYKSELTLEYEKARSSGLNWHAANKKAYVEWDSPWAVKMLVDTFSDPTLFIGFGGYAKVVGNTSRFGKTFGAFERGYGEVTNEAFSLLWPSNTGIIPFVAGTGVGLGVHAATGGILLPVVAGLATLKATSVAYNLVGRTIVQAGNQFAAEAGNLLYTLSRETYIKDSGITSVLKAKAIPLEHVRKTAEAGIAEFLRNPNMHQMTRAGKLGRHVWEAGYKWIGFDGPNGVEGLLALLYKDGGDSVLSTLREGGSDVLLNLNDMLHSSIGIKNFLDKDTVITQILSLVAREPLSEPATAYKTVRVWLDSVIKQGMDNGSSALYRQNTSPTKAFRNFTSQASRNYIENARNPLWRRSLINGRISALQAQMDNISKWGGLNWVEQNISYPFSRSILLFLNYGPWNVLEQSYRSLAAGVLPWIPRGDDVFTRFNSLSSNLLSTPYSMRTLGVEDGFRFPGPTAVIGGKGEQSVLYGNQTVTKGFMSNIPIVYLSFGSALGKVPIQRLGGDKLYKFINNSISVGGKRFKYVPEWVQGFSLQSWNDVGNNYSQKITTHFLTEKYLQELAKVAPLEMAELSSSVGSIFDAGLGDSLGAMQLQRFQKHIFDTAIQGPKAVRDLKLNQASLYNRKLVSQAADLLTKWPYLDSAYQNRLLEDLRTGVLHNNNISDYMLSYYASWLEQTLMGKAEWQSYILKDASAQLSTVSPKSVEEVLNFMKELDSLDRSVSGEHGTVSNMRRVATELGHDVGTGERQKIAESFFALSEPLLEQRQSMYRTHINHLAEALGEAPTSFDYSKVDWRVLPQSVPSKPWAFESLPLGGDVFDAQQAWVEAWDLEKSAVESTLAFNNLIKAYKDNPKELETLKSYLRSNNGSNTLTVYRGTKFGDMDTLKSTLNVSLSKETAEAFASVKTGSIPSTVNSYAVSIDDVIAAGDQESTELIVKTSGLAPAAKSDVQTRVEEILNVSPQVIRDQLKTVKIGGALNFDHIEGVLTLPKNILSRKPATIRAELYMAMIEAEVVRGNKPFIDNAAKLVSQLKPKLEEPLAGFSPVPESLPKPLNPDVEAAAKMWSTQPTGKAGESLLSGAKAKAVQDLIEAYETHPQELIALRQYLRELSNSNTITVYRGAAPGQSVFSRKYLNVSLSENTAKSFSKRPDAAGDLITGRIDTYTISVDSVLAAGHRRETELIVDASKLNPVFAHTMRDLLNEGHIFTPQAALFWEQLRAVVDDVVAGVNSEGTTYIKSEFPASTKVLEIPDDVKILLNHKISLMRQKDAAMSGPGNPRAVQLAMHKAFFKEHKISWEEFVSNIEEAWNKYRYQSLSIDTKIQSIDTQVAAKHGFNPPKTSIRSPLSGTLSPSDIASLYTNKYASVDQMTANMVDTGSMTMTTKHDFTAQHLTMAEEKAAEVGKKAADFGYTKDSVEAVYDNLMRSVSLEPSDVTFSSPAREMFEGIRQEMTLLLQASQMKPHAAERFNAYLDAVASNLEKTTAFNTKKITRDIPIPPVPEGHVRFYKGSSLEQHTALGSKIPHAGMISDPGSMGAFNTGNTYFTLNLESAKEYQAMAKSRNLTDITYYIDLPDSTLIKQVSSGSDGLIEVGNNFTVSKDQSGKPLSELLLKSGGFLEDFHIPVSMAQKSKPLGVSITNNDTAWHQAKEDAMQRAVVSLKTEFTDYTSGNAIDAAMKTIFPFWTYENQRWPWIIKHAIQHPGMTTTWGRYTESSEEGYVGVGGDLQANPLRGTVFMGGMRRLYMKDYQEYSDQFQTPTAIIDSISRFGFYPGIQFLVPKAVFGAKSHGAKPQLGEVIPPWATTMLSAATIVDPGSTWSKILNEQIFASNYRDYRTVIVATSRGLDGIGLLGKIRAGTTLTDEESNGWYSAQQRVIGLSGVLDAQFGLFRLSPKEKTIAYEAASHGKEVLSGIPKGVQEQTRDRFAVTGQRYSDVFPLDPLQQYVLREYLDKYKAWLRPNTAPLLPSVFGDLQFKTDSYYKEVDKIWTSARTNNFYQVNSQTGARELIAKSFNQLQDEFRAGAITPQEYLSGLHSTMQRASASADAVSKLDYYKDIPKTRNEREAYFEKFGIIQPTYSAGQELLWEYYSLSPQMQPDPETGVLRPDWDTYFATLDVLISVMPAQSRERLLARIQADWTDTQRLYWSIDQKFLRAYRNVAGVVQSQYSKEQQTIIDRYVKSDAADKEKIRQIPLSDTQIQSITVGGIVYTLDTLNLISDYNSKVSTFRHNLRRTNPQLDAWLLFWQVTTSPVSDKSRAAYNDLLKAYRPGGEPFLPTKPK